MPVDARLVRLSIEAFKQHHEEGTLPERVQLSKAFACDQVKAVDGQERTLDFVISTQSEDRERDTIAADGWALANYKKNPVVLWAHNGSLPPIARAFDTRVDAGRLKSKAEFTPPDMNHPLGFGFGSTIHRMYIEGYLNAVSVGFRPIKWTRNEERGAWAIDFLEQELLEFSPVPIPANPEALQEASAKGLDLGPIYRWCEWALDGESDLLLPRSVIEDAHKALKPQWGGSSKGAQIKIESGQDPETILGAIRRLLGMGADKKPISYQSAHPNGTAKADEDEAWSAGKEVKAAEIDDLKVMCAWFDHKAADKKTSYKLPHHKADGHMLVWRGVRAAMGALLGARGGADIPDGDRKGVYNHLVKHYKEFDKDPPDFKVYAADELVSLFPEEDEAMEKKLDELLEAIKAMRDELAEVKASLKAESEPEPEPEPEERGLDLSDPDVVAAIKSSVIGDLTEMLDDMVREVTGKVD